VLQVFQVSAQFLEDDFLSQHGEHVVEAQQVPVLQFSLESPPEDGECLRDGSTGLVSCDVILVFAVQQLWWNFATAIFGISHHLLRQAVKAVIYE
jgi:hypothetical protein